MAALIYILLALSSAAAPSASLPVQWTQAAMDVTNFGASYNSSVRTASPEAVRICFELTASATRATGPGGARSACDPFVSCCRHGNKNISEIAVSPLALCMDTPAGISALRGAGWSLGGTAIRPKPTTPMRPPGSLVFGVSAAIRKRWAEPTLLCVTVTTQLGPQPGVCSSAEALCGVAGCSFTFRTLLMPKPKVKRCLGLKDMMKCSVTGLVPTMCPPGYGGDCSNQCPPGTAGGNLTVGQQCTPCTGEAEFTVAPGSPACRLCPPGRVANAQHTGCVCPPGLVMGADNTTCVCPQGYGGGANGVCVQCQPGTFGIDLPPSQPCAVCGGALEYTDTAGRSSCQLCPEAHPAVPSHDACDVDECAAPVSPCSPLATCTNTIGGYNCTCVTGYVGDGKACQDDNECNPHDKKPCHADAFCINYIGGYSCHCNIGFVGDGWVNCTLAP